MAYGYLVSKEMGSLKIFVEAKGDKFVEFSNNGVALGLIITVSSWVMGADLTEILGIGLVEVESANPYLIEGAKQMTKLGEFIATVIEWVLRRSCGCWGTCARDSTRVELPQLIPVLRVLNLEFLSSVAC